MKSSILMAVPLMMLCSGCLTRPAFVPVPSHVFSRFEALREPRTDLPVGALWIDGYGPTGDAAAADNLVTIKSLSGITFDNGFQASLTLGLLKFLDLDPSYSRKMTAHFGDLSIVRVKDFSKLSGPAEQPRIYEALKAGSITITAIGNAGLDIENRAVSQHLPVFGRGTSAVAKSFTIDGRDMFIAFEVATMRTISSDVVTASLSPGRVKRVSVGSTDLMVVTEKHPDSCFNGKVHVEERRDIRRSGSASAGLQAGNSKLLPVPVSDGKGGLFITAELIEARTEPSVCKVVVQLRLGGNRIDRLGVRQPVEY